jgi:hypothetical protein
MTYPIKINFTPAEFAIIADRLDLCDCIADALTGDMEYGQERDLERDIIMTAAVALTGPTVTLYDDRDLAILENAIDGSTIPYKAKDCLEEGGTEAEQAWARSVRRHFKAIERKFEAATGIEARFPRL